MSELISGLDGPVYVERVALYDNRRRAHAKRAIKKALELQVTGTGFAFIEVLSECPVHLGLDPEASEDWVRDNMVPVFPLGVKKDITDGASFPAIPTATFDPERTLRPWGQRIATKLASLAVSRRTSTPTTSASSWPGREGTAPRRRR